MDVETLLWNMLLIGLSVVAHCSVAYYFVIKIAPKHMLRTVKAWIAGQEGISYVLKYLADAWDRKLEDGKSVGDIISQKIQDKLVLYCKSPEAINAMNAFIEVMGKTVQDKIAKWAGGKITGATQQIKAGQNAAEGDIMSMVKQVIMQKIMGSPVVQNMIGGVLGPAPVGLPPANPPVV